MPELPEVENIALGLREVIVGARIQCLSVRTPGIIRGSYRRRWRPFLEELRGRRIKRVARRAKRLVLTTEGALALVFQLGMTGKFLLLRHGEKGRTAERDKHTRLVMTFEEGRELRFIDVRRFGRVWCLRDLDPDDPDAAMEAAGMTPLGPEPLQMKSTVFVEALRANRPVKALLLDQTRIAGLGNIYVDESLWAAGIRPDRSCASITGEEAACLLREIKNVLRRAIRHGGTTFSDFRNPYGDMGRFRRRLRVYGRAGEPCRRCGTAIERHVIAGRGTHMCPRCQPEDS